MMLKNGFALPEAWRDPPILEPENTWYYDAFTDLSTCRQFGFSAGPIPWTAIVKYIEWEEIEDDSFIFIIRSMDSAYLEHIREIDQDSSVNKNKPQGNGHRINKK